MQNLIQLILRYSSVWSFLFLEVLSLYLVIQFNQRQNNIFFSSAGRVSGGVYEQMDELTDYVGLRKQINELTVENARLRGLLNNYNYTESQTSLSPDSIVEYINFIPAVIISKSIVGKNNSITINRGRLHGIEPHMGVISSDGIVGIVRNVTDHYSVIMSTFHSKSKVSALVKGRGALGTLSWENLDTRFMNLKDIPIYYEEVAVGDTVVTSSYSNMFPENIVIGEISEINPVKNENNLSIKVRMKNKFHTLDYVYVVDFLNKEEKEALQKELND